LKGSVHRVLGDPELAEVIARGADDLQLPLAASVVFDLVRYLRLIERWNATYNLTAIRNPADMATHHILDCLAAAVALVRRPGPPTRRLLDAGSGAGLPGLVFARVVPDLEVACVDAVGKKVAFMTQVAAELGMRNVSVVHGRVETMPAAAHEVIASRAFTSLAAFVASTRHLVADNGQWMAMKGLEPREEIGALHDVSAVVEPIVVPGLAASRCVVWMRPR
jgi:16S rRNA (guanine527-N7)-methyltransferase